ncbi:MAG: RNA polymerase subunit sigma [Caryophanon sp.]|nr:RNA polymerase subunit sigma [Caryophanon sp.]
MSLKGVELQIAIPKTFDAGKVVEQQQQHVANQQMHANEALKREVERQQKIVNETDGLTGINEEEERQREQEREQQERKKNEQLAKRAKHPFKGNFVDFSG